MTSEGERALPCPYGKYELLDRIGDGGIVEIFRARLPGVAGFQKTLVIKRLRARYQDIQGYVQMFIDEAKLAVGVQHRNVVQIFDLGSLKDGQLYMAMEYVDGPDLRRLLELSQEMGLRLPLWLVVHVIAEVLEALSFAHELTDEHGRPRAIVHCDVRPSTIFVSRTGAVKLGDFGLAIDATRNEEPFGGQLKDRMPYMSPEQLNGERPDARSDLFAAGVVLWEALTLERLFDAPDGARIMSRVIGDERLPPSEFNAEVSPELDACVLSALAVQPDLRPQSARVFRDQLLDLLSPVSGRVDMSDMRRALEPFLARDAGKATEPPLPELDELVQRYVHDRFTSDLPAPFGPSRPARVAIHDAEAIRAGHPKPTGATPPDSDFPFFLRDPDETRGPFGPARLFRTLGSLSDEELQNVLLSADQIRFSSVGRLFELLGSARVKPGISRATSLFSGALTSHSAVAVFGEIARSRSSGRLIVTPEDQPGFRRTELSVIEGRLVGAHHNAATAALWQSLLESPFFIARNLPEAVHTAVRVDRNIEHLLPTEVVGSIRQARALSFRRHLRELFTWTRGKFVFDTTAVPVSCDHEEEPIAAAVRLVAQTYDQPRLDAALARFEGVRLQRAPQFGQLIDQMKLRPSEKSLLGALGWGRTLGESMATCSEDSDLRFVWVLAFACLELGALKPEVAMRLSPVTT